MRRALDGCRGGREARARQQRAVPLVVSQWIEHIATYYGFAVDGTFSVPAGRIGFKHRIEVSIDGERFKGVATFEVLDPTGAVLFTDTVTTDGRRQHPVAP